MLGSAPLVPFLMVVGILQLEVDNQLGLQVLGLLVVLVLLLVPWAFQLSYQQTRAMAHQNKACFHLPLRA